MDFWIKKNQCTGCGVCSNLCSHNAIKMVSNELGFLQPVINKNLCIDCGICKSKCPILNNMVSTNDSEPHVYAAWSKDKDNRFNSTSGGIFFEVGKAILSEGGYVVGAQYNTDNLVEHYMANSEEELIKLRQSKYLQSDTKQIYIETKSKVLDNKVVAFCGTPCQIAGLKSFLGKDYDNLITIEFICRGVNSPKAYKAWLNEIENKHNSKAKQVWFKYKEFGWKKSPKCTRIDFADDTYVLFNDKDNLFMIGYLGPNLYIRPSCGDCKFKGLPRQADITLGDFWGIDNKLDNDKGTSMVLINSTKGKKWLNKIKQGIELHEVNFEKVVKGNVCFTESVKINKKSSKFLKELDKKSFSASLKKYNKTPIHYKIKGLVKKFLYQ